MGQTIVCLRALGCEWGEEKADFVFLQELLRHKRASKAQFSVQDFPTYVPCLALPPIICCCCLYFWRSPMLAGPLRSRPERRYGGVGSPSSASGGLRLPLRSSRLGRSAASYARAALIGLVFHTQMLAIAAFAPSLAYNAALAPVVRPALAPRAVAPVAQLDQAAGFEKGMANFQVRRAAHRASRPPARLLLRLSPSSRSAPRALTGSLCHRLTSGRLPVVGQVRLWSDRQGGAVER